MVKRLRNVALSGVFACINFIVEVARMHGRRYLKIGGGKVWYGMVCFFI